MESKIYKIRLKKGDTVIVRSGKYKGKTGKITATHPRENKVTVEGVNIVKKHVSLLFRVPPHAMKSRPAPNVEAGDCTKWFSSVDSVTGASDSRTSRVRCLTFKSVSNGEGEIRSPDWRSRPKVTT